MRNSARPQFWRDNRIPHIELRYVEDGREVCYAPHSHTQWSLGAIAGGRSYFHYRDQNTEVCNGDLVVINPNWVHACNPMDKGSWSYWMLYVDTLWLAQLRCDIGLLSEPYWLDFNTSVVSSPVFFKSYLQMAQRLMSDDVSIGEKQSSVVYYLSDLMKTLTTVAPGLDQGTPSHIEDLANYLKTHCTEDVAIEALCDRWGYSHGHLIKSFKDAYGLTPHAYRINARVQQGQRALRGGASIADTALSVGFADQPHFQRTFKRMFAATPRQYQRPLITQKEQATDGQ